MNRFPKAAVTNEAIQSFLVHPHYKAWWTQAHLAKNPPVRVEFEHVIILATVNEALNFAKRKSFRKLLNIQPLRPDDPLHPFRLVYIHEASSPYRQHYERRVPLKELLGAGKKLVPRARTFSKQQFLSSLTEEERALIRTRLQISAADFWQECRKGRMRQTLFPFKEGKT